MAWNSIGTINVNEAWSYSGVIPDNAQLVRLAGGTKLNFCWIGFFKDTSTQEVIGLKAFKSGGKWRVYELPLVSFPIRVGAVLPKPTMRYTDPETFNLSCSVWIPPDVP